MRVSKLAACVVLLASCNTTASGYPFSSRAVYEAPRSGFRVEVVASGRVDAGHDTSTSGTGFARLCPSPASPSPSITLTLGHGSGSVAWEIAGTPVATGTAAWDSKSSLKSLEGLLLRAGYGPPDRAELDEMVRAIDGVLLGPKGTTIGGQSRAIGVVSTRLDRELPASPPTSSA